MDYLLKRGAGSDTMKRIREGFQGQRLFVLPPAIQEHSRQLPVVRDLYVTDVGHYPAAGQHYVHRPSGRPECILIYCVSGSGWCRMKGRKHVVSQGAALLVPAGVPHTYGADPVTPWAIYWAHFRGRSSGSYLEALEVSSSRPVVFAPDIAVLDQAFEELLSYIPHGYTDASLLGMSTSLGRLLGLLRWHQRSPSARDRHGEEKILRTIRHMREHLHEPCRLSILAEMARLSVSHYCALFRKFTNTSPVVFYSRLKAQQACHLLAATDLTAAEIASQLGYGDPFYFSRMFKKMIGVSPTHYRRQVGTAQA